MKKTIALVISMFMLIFALTACGGSKQSEEPAEETTTVEETVEETTADPVAGATYNTTSYDLGDGEGMREVQPEDKTDSLVFGTDNTVQSHGYDADLNEMTTDGTYVVKGDVVTITWNVNGESRDADYTISGDTLTNVFHESTTVYTKQ